MKKTNSKLYTLAELVDGRRLRQQELADAAGVTQATVSRWISDKAAMPHVSAAKIAAFTKTSLVLLKEQFLFGVGK